MKTSASLPTIATNLRLLVLEATEHAGSGHPTSCFSAVEICTSLFFHTMRYDPFAYEYPNNDRFILSKGHAAPLLYAIWCELGLISKDELLTLRKLGSRLEGHPGAEFPYHEVATGSLGQGLGIAIGEALAAKKHNLDYRTFVLMGDSELAEGSVWEAAQIATKYNLENLIAYIDANRLGQRGESLIGTDYQTCAEKWRAFGWDAHIVDGHDLEQLTNIGQLARTNAHKPTVIIAKTIKGFDLGTAVEDQLGYHGKSIPQAIAATYKTEHTYQAGASYTPPAPNLLAKKTPNTQPAQERITDSFELATRRAYGKSLQYLGTHTGDLIVLDAEVKNSTFSELFEAVFPDRFIECYIAEQTMISIATGLARRGFVPFCSTFAAFLTRAFDQLRMAAIGKIPLRICGSHAGVSIGEDGPSQMGLEDIAMMRLLPGSTIFYPADIHATRACMEKMYAYNDGISYIRTTREETEILYTPETNFDDGYQVLTPNSTHQLCIIGAGITVFEALKAANILKKQGILAKVIDCYQIKPLPSEQLAQEIAACQGRAIIVEDHYLAGGLGEAIVQSIPTIKKFHLCAIRKLPHSGTPTELRALMGIDANAIEQAAKKIIQKD